MIHRDRCIPFENLFFINSRFFLEIFTKFEFQEIFTNDSRTMREISWSKRDSSLISQESYSNFQINRQLDCFYFHNFGMFDSTCQKSLSKIFDHFGV